MAPSGLQLLAPRRKWRNRRWFSRLAATEAHKEAGVGSRGRAILPLMAREETPERSTRPPEVVVISITVMDPPPVRGRPLRERLAGISVLRRALLAVAVVLALAALGAIVTNALQSSRTTPPAGARPAQQVQSGERAEIAGALGYPYPLRCLTITISASNPDYARADVDRTNGCGRYRGYINASLHRVDGAWRLVLDEGQLFVPNRCLSPVIALHDPRFARGHFDRTICMRVRTG